jgi:hypothetical protein
MRSVVRACSLKAINIVTKVLANCSYDSTNRCQPQISHCIYELLYHIAECSFIGLINTRGHEAKSDKLCFQ